MSLLQKASVNPLNQVRPQEESTPLPPTTDAPDALAPWAARPGVAEPAPAPAPAPTAGQYIPAVVPEPARGALVNVPANLPVASNTFDPEQGGFTCLQVGFGSFPRVKVNRGKFEINDIPAGSVMVVNIFDVRDMLVIRDRKSEDNAKIKANVIWSYDGITTTNGESVEAVRRQWEADGFHDHNVRNYAEAVAMIVDCDDPGRIGDVVLLNIPPTSKKRLAGYQVVLQRTRGTFIPNVLTRITAEEIKSDGRSWDSFGFAFAGMLQQAA